MLPFVIIVITPIKQTTNPRTLFRLIFSPNRKTDSIIIKTGEEELKLADQFKDIIKRVIEEERKNKDNEDPKYITLKEELERLLKLKDINECSAVLMKDELQGSSIEVPL